MPTVLITGANRGLGLEFVRQYAADEWQVIAGCRKPEKAGMLQDLAAAFPNVRFEALDVADDQSIKALADKLKDTAVDLLINNAGIYSGAESDKANDTSQNFGSLSSFAWEKVLRINTIAPIMVTEAFVPHLKKGSLKRVINVTSRMGSLTELETKSGSIAYRSSKTALNSAMRTIANELRDMGLTITNIHPGWVKTDIGGGNADLLPEQSVAAMRQTISQLKAEKTGQFLNYDGQVIPW